MVEIARCFELRTLIEIFEIVPEVRIVENSPQIALKVTVIHRVEAVEGGKHTNVSFGEYGAA
jgi:hypothetical protein